MRVVTTSHKREQRRATRSPTTNPHPPSRHHPMATRCHLRCFFLRLVKNSTSANVDTSAACEINAIINFYHPVIAQLVEHLTVESRSNQMVPGSIPGGRIAECPRNLSFARIAGCSHGHALPPLPIKNGLQQLFKCLNAWLAAKCFHSCPERSPHA